MINASQSPKGDELVKNNPPEGEKPIDFNFSDNVDETEEESSSMKEIYAQSLRDVEVGEIIKGKVIGITNDSVLVDIGYKSEGSISINEFRTVGGEYKVKIGDEIDVLLEEKEDRDGLIVLSKEKAEKIKIWEDLNRIHDKSEAIEGTIIDRIKGGFIVDIGVKAFLPGSQVDLRPVKDMDKLIGKSYRMKVIKLNQRRGNIVLSRRAILEEERKEQKTKTLQALEEGKVVKGVVKNITEYGAFIDLGGIDGLLHITDMSWGRISHPSEVLMLGDETEVVILKYDRPNERVSLGLKQKSSDPWQTADQKYPVGTKVKGKVVSMMDYGAFVELEQGIEGLIHVSEMSWTKKIKHPSKVVAIGDNVEAVVLDMNKEAKRISLGLKQLENNPWDTVDKKYPIGARVEGRIRNLAEFGAFMELEEGIDGLVHISDMSWAKRIRHPSEILRKGEKVSAIVLSIDKENHRISLGLKQAQEDPWQTEVPAKYKIGMDVKGKIVRITEFGAFVELEDGIEGLLHVSEITKEKINKPEEVISVGDELTMKIIKLDADERKIGLSLRAYQENLDEEQEETPKISTN
jgi:small subunit ribosomal protein S1